MDNNTPLTQDSGTSDVTYAWIYCLQLGYKQLSSVFDRSIKFLRGIGFSMGSCKGCDEPGVPILGEDLLEFAGQIRYFCKSGNR